MVRGVIDGAVTVMVGFGCTGCGGDNGAAMVVFSELLICCYCCCHVIDGCKKVVFSTAFVVFCVKIFNMKNNNLLKKKF